MGSGLRRVEDYLKMDDQNRNLILATGLSFLVILVWFLLFPPEPPVEDPNALPPVAATEQDAEGVDIAPRPPSIETAAEGEPAVPTDVALSESARIPIETPTVTGSISLRGGTDRRPFASELCDRGGRRRKCTPPFTNRHR